MSKEAMTLALEALNVAEHFVEEYAASKYYFAHIVAKTALEEALAKQKQGEPVGVVNFADADSWYFLPLVPLSELPEGTKFYTTPQPAQKPLTDEQIEKMRHLIDWTAHWSYGKFARAIEAAHGIKS